MPFPCCCYLAGVSESIKSDVSADGTLENFTGSLLIVTDGEGIVGRLSSTLGYMSINGKHETKNFSTLRHKRYKKSEGIRMNIGGGNDF